MPGRYDDPAAKLSSPIEILSPEPDYYDPDLEDSVDSTLDIWMVANGSRGVIAFYPLVQSKSGGIVKKGVQNFAIGNTFKRYPADMSAGHFARFAMFGYGQFYLPYYTDADGNVQADGGAGAWCPFGYVDQNVTRRHAGSPIPTMAVPIYPALWSNDYSAAILGEADNVLCLTSGYAMEEEVFPGWVALVDEAGWHCPLAVPKPDSWAILP